MQGLIITKETVDNFKHYLENDEKSELTIKKYIRDVLKLAEFLALEPISKEKVIEYKQNLISSGYAKKSINSIIASINSFCDFSGTPHCKVKSIKIQEQIFSSEQKELTENEFQRLVSTAKKQKNERLALILKTLYSTGIRISELRFITVQAVKDGETLVTLKGKTREIFIPKDTKKELLNYIKKKNLSSGPVFRTKTNKPVDRSNIWREMKQLCKSSNVNPQKVFPHNIRHLFARIFYSIGKDIVKLAGILGHSSINTTRIYTRTTSKEYRKLVENMHIRI